MSIDDATPEEWDKVYRKYKYCIKEGDDVEFTSWNVTNDAFSRKSLER